MNSENQIPILLLLALFALVAASCTQGAETPKTLERDRFVEVYIAAIRRESPVAEKADSTSGMSLDSILARHGTNQTQFWRTVDSYRMRPGEWKPFFDEVTKRLERKTVEGSTPPAPPVSQ